MNNTTADMIVDPGLDEAVKTLTPEKIEQVVDQVLTKECAARLKVYLESCVRCGLCAEACHSFLSRDRDPNYSPVGKVKNTMRELIRRRGKLDAKFLRSCAITAYTECNTCRRCSMYCPFGIDIAYLLITIRRICYLLGMVPQYIQDTTNSHSVAMNQMWIQQDEWIDTLQWQEEEARLEMPDARIPLEKEGADIMYSVIGPEAKVLVRLIKNMSIIMKVAGLDWTMPASDGWDNSNLAMFAGDFEIMGRIERHHWETAARLKVKKVVMGECGHAFRASVYDGPRWLGWKYPPMEMVHAAEFYYDLVSSGKIKIRKKIKDHVTLQDPCNIVRGRGLGDKLRYLVNATCENFTEMTPNYEHNYCCNAGGGAINCGPPYKKSRMVSNIVKAEQIANTGADVVITPCHNCHGGLEQVFQHYKMKKHCKFLSDILMEVMEIPDELKGK